MKRQRGYILFLTAILVLSIFMLVHSGTFVLVSSVNAKPNNSQNLAENKELTVKEKYEKLIVKALEDEKNLLKDGFVTEEVYKLQCKPFEEALTKLESRTEEEILEDYKLILVYFFDQTSEYEATGEKINKEFQEYIISEIDKYDVLL